MTGSQDILIYVPTLFGVDPNAVFDLSIQCRQQGTDVTMSYNSAGSPFIPVPKSYSNFGGVPCFILDVGSSIATSIVEVTAYIGPGQIRNAVSTIFLNSEEFKIDGMAPSEYFYINDRTALKKDPNVEFVDNLTVIKLMQILAQRNNVNIQIDGIIDYKIFSYESRKNAPLFEIFEQLALEGGANAVVLFDMIRIIPWGTSAAPSSYNYSLDQVLSDVKYALSAPEFDAVQIEVTPQITPWNSFYVGIPEKLASLNFEAGPVSTKDLSLGTGVINPSKEWVYPETPGNDWFEAEIAFRQEENQKGENVINKLTSVEGIQSVWDYKFGMTDEYEYNLAFRDAQANANLSVSNKDSGRDYVQEYLSKYQYSTQVYKLLRRWDYASTRVVGQGDIHPDIFVVPGDSAPEQTENLEVFKIKDDQELIITQTLKPGAAFETTNMPEQFKGITPDGYTARIGKFAGDGSFEVGIKFGPARRKRKYIDVPNISVVVYPDALYNTIFFGTISVQSNRSYATVTYADWESSSPPADSLARHLDDVCRRRILSEAVVFTQEGSVSISPTGGPIVDYRNGFSLENIQDQNAFNTENIYLTNAMRIKSIAPAQLPDGSDDPNTAIIWFTQACRLNYTGAWSMAKARVNHVTSQVAKLSSTGKYESFTDSGLVEQNQQSIKGSWSVYGLKRKTFPATYIRSSSVSRVLYRGVSTKLDLEVVETLKKAGNNVKVVSPSVMTDTVGANSHLKQLAEKLYDQLKTPFLRFSCEYVGMSIFDMPPVGAYAGVGGFYSQVIETSFSISDGQISHNFTVGKLPIL